MKIFFIGDIYGRSGRDAITHHLSAIREEFKPDLVIANVDNASHGYGVTPAIIKDLHAAGVDLFTGGDHVWDQKDMLTHMDRAPWVLRGINYPEGTPGKGWQVIETPTKKKLLVIHCMGRVFIERLYDDPFAAVETLLKKYVLGRDVDAILIDFHGEATSEKNAFGFTFDGRVSAILGTHTHIPTADIRILPQGTAYMTDVGMTGDYNSVIGADKTVPMNYFRTGLRVERFKPAEGEGTLSGVFIETDDGTGLAKTVTPIRRGGVLGQ